MSSLNGQNLVLGLVEGGIYGLLAVGIVLVYRGSRVLNFAQGELGTVALIVAWFLSTDLEAGAVIAHDQSELRRRLARNAHFDSSSVAPWECVLVRVRDSFVREQGDRNRLFDGECYRIGREIQPHLGGHAGERLPERIDQRL